MDTEILMVPIIIFMVVVAPIWLVLHYRSKRQVGQGLTEDEFVLLNDLKQQADKMSQRIETLEAILDSEAPQWRKRDEGH
ncbi:envelope stress response membrane protein PspB [Shewanella surugensis]|uniref:Envelope stress response membrane protein PspB n=1 Tax=Shewanella surugensis TaxID=212020 RepID=A0ABT0L8E1_9GAMM|nr:envelope stress response membrane protein PspB [Shewanella surugensis]MCL1123928.1 envelope stress response membrane protein PspB [Shewanella surugensis]